MKRCPTCQKTFDDSMRFCQTDGTPLVDDAPPVDPYKTMVASKEEIFAAISSEPPPDRQGETHEAVPAAPVKVIFGEAEPRQADAVPLIKAVGRALIVTVNGIPGLEQPFA